MKPAKLFFLLHVFLELWEITFNIVVAFAKISVCSDDLSCPLDVTKCCQSNTYIKTMGLAAFWTHTQRHTRGELDPVCLRVTQVWWDRWNTDTRRLGKITEMLLPCPNHSSIYNSSLACSVLLMGATARQAEHFFCFIYLSAHTQTWF